MATYQNAKALSALTLGKTTEYCSEYNANLLQGVPRSLNRDDLALNADQLPFLGEDVWYGYELSWLNSKGKPVVAVAEFRFPCTSPYLVESKSFKLYLNSFNQTKFDDLDTVLQHLIKDLSHTSGHSVQVNLFHVDDCPPLALNDISFGNASDKNLGENTKIQIRRQCIDDEDISVDNYQYQREMLTDIHSFSANERSQKVPDNNGNNESCEELLVSHLLKSNCLITNQPDWASVYIQYKGKAINHAVLLAYIISFRQHNEFHEQCVERIFCDLQHYAQLTELSVFARYTRRGGLDINPFRSTHLATAPNGRTLRQ